MTQTPTPKKPLLIALLTTAVLVTAGLSYYFSTSQETGTVPEQIPVDTAKKSVKKPDVATALTDLFGISGPGGSVKTAPDALTGLWFEQSFSVDNRQYHVVFTKTQTVDPEKNAPFDSHVQGVIVGAATYVLKDEAWQLVGKQKEIGEIGSWGDAPEVKNAAILTLSPSQIAFMIDFGYGMGGFFEEGKVLFGFSNDTWQDLGFIQTGSNNSGSCDDTEQETEPDSPLMGPCWGYTGSITAVPETHNNFPDLLIVKQGTEITEQQKLPVPAKNSTYIFDGQKYADATEEE
jgi:hypothetical protein